MNVKLIVISMLTLFSSLCSNTDEFNKQLIAKYDAVIIYSFGKTASSSLQKLFGDLTEGKTLDKFDAYGFVFNGCVDTHLMHVVEKIPFFLKRETGSDCQYFKKSLYSAGFGLFSKLR